MREVLPLIWRARPAVRLLVVGRHPPRSVLRLAKDSRIEVTGLVSDMRPYLWKSTVGLAPMRIAAGMQNKVIEGMAAGLPMVITSAANEGIGASQENVCIADDPEDMAAAVLGLLGDPHAARRLGESAQRFAAANWSWEHHFDQLESILQDLAMRNQTSARDRHDGVRPLGAPPVS